MSATHGRSRASASNSRLTRSGARRALLSRSVVRGLERGLRLLAATCAGQARLSHESRDPLAAHQDAFVGQLRLDPGSSAGSPSGFMDRPNPPGQGSVRLGPGQRNPLAPRVVSARGDAEHARHGRNAKLGPVRAHEPEDLFRPVSRAYQAVACARISRSSRSLRTSRRSRRNSSRSAVVVPSRWRPSSRSACLTQLRIDCAEGSNSRARWSGLRPDRTRSTICCRYSAGYGGLDLGIVGTSSSKDEVSTKPGQALGSHRTVRERFAAVCSP